MRVVINLKKSQWFDLFRLVLFVSVPNFKALSSSTLEKKQIKKCNGRLLRSRLETVSHEFDHSI